MSWWSGFFFYTAGSLFSQDTYPLEDIMLPLNARWLEFSRCANHLMSFSGSQNTNRRRITCCWYLCRRHIKCSVSPRPLGAQRKCMLVFGARKDRCMSSAVWSSIGAVVQRGTGVRQRTAAYMVILGVGCWEGAGRSLGLTGCKCFPYLPRQAR